MERGTAVFTITETKQGYEIKSKRHCLYNRCNITNKRLFPVMTEITNFFNNELKLAVVFDVD